MEIIYGMNSVRDLLRQGTDVCRKIIIASGRSGSSLNEIIETARIKKVPLQFSDRKYLDKLTGITEHQGIAAYCSPFVYSDLNQIIENRNTSFHYDLILVLDSIMDPQNLGAMIRTAFCLGANGIVIPENRAAQITASVHKASAGSVRQIPVARVANLAQTLDDLKGKGFWVFGADTHGGRDIREMDFNCSVVLVMGGEAKGIRPLLKKKCDFLITIPLAADFDSFNVSVAAGILQYEIFCQRNKKNRI